MSNHEEPNAMSFGGPISGPAPTPEETKAFTPYGGWAPGGGGMAPMSEGEIAKYYSTQLYAPSNDEPNASLVATNVPEASADFVTNFDDKGRAIYPNTYSPGYDPTEQEINEVNAAKLQLFGVVAGYIATRAGLTIEQVLAKALGKDIPENGDKPTATSIFNRGRGDIGVREMVAAVNRATERVTPDGIRTMISNLEQERGTQATFLPDMLNVSNDIDRDGTDALGNARERRAHRERLASQAGFSPVGEAMSL